MHRHWARSVAVSLALCAMVLRAFLPDGWMPAAGAAPFVICSVDKAGHHDGKPQAPRSHAPCAFAAASPLAPPATLAAAPAATGPFTRFAPSFAREAAATDPIHRPNAARAPPSFS